VDGRAVHRQRQGLANARVLDARLEHDGHHADGRGEPQPAARDFTAQLLRTELDHVGAVQPEIDGLIPRGAPHLDFHRIEERPAARRIFVGGIDRTPAGGPLGKRKARGECAQKALRRRRIGGVERFADFHAQRAAITRPRGGRGRNRQQ
jgi:hypothetical protein